MNLRWLRVPLLGAITSAMLLSTTSVAQAQPRFETRVVWRDGHRVVVRVGEERPRRYYWRHQRTHRVYYYDRWHHRHYYWR
jgi:hypothetical protein